MIEDILKFFGYSLMVLGLIILGTGIVKADEPLRFDAIYPVYKIQSGAISCSAVAIETPGLEQTVLLTAAHCIDKSKEGGRVADADNFITEFKVLKVSNDTDLAAIIVPDKNFQPKKALVAQTMIAEEGDDVVVVGYPYGLSRITTKGQLGKKITTMTPLNNIEDFMLASPNLDVGNSGGGLFQKNGDHWELIGIASMKGPANFTNFFTTLSNIHKFVN